MESYSSKTIAAPVSEVWPPPSTEQSPVYEFRLNHAMIRSRMIRSRTIFFRVYQPNFWRRKLEISEHGLAGFLVRSGASYLPWSDIKAITIARKRRQVRIFYHYPTLGFRLGFRAEVAQIFSVDPESFELLGDSLKRFAKCTVVEDDKIYWSYSKLMIWYSLFWLYALSVVFQNHGRWAAYGKHMLVLLNHLVSINLP